MAAGAGGSASCCGSPCGACIECARAQGAFLILTRVRARMHPAEHALSALVLKVRFFP